MSDADQGRYRGQGELALEQGQVDGVLGGSSAAPGTLGTGGGTIYIFTTEHLDPAILTKI